MSAGEGSSLPEISDIGVPILITKVGAFNLSSIFLSSLSTCKFSSTNFAANDELLVSNEWIYFCFII